jgi:hypothetical protein
MEMNQIKPNTWKKGEAVSLATTNAGPLEITLVFFNGKGKDVFMVTMDRIEALELGRDIVAHAIENMKEER